MGYKISLNEEYMKLDIWRKEIQDNNYRVKSSKKYNAITKAMKNMSQKSDKPCIELNSVNRPPITHRGANMAKIKFIQKSKVKFGLDKVGDSDE